jgi:hypothetical protein
MKKRILVLLTVVAQMMVMLAVLHLRLRVHCKNATKVMFHTSACKVNSHKLT